MLGVVLFWFVCFWFCFLNMGVVKISIFVKNLKDIKKTVYFGLSKCGNGAALTRRAV